MASRPSRYRSSTSASNPLATTKAAEVLKGLLHAIHNTISAPGDDDDEHTAGRYPDIDVLQTLLRQVHQFLTAHAPPSPAQDDFRHMHGFQLLVNVLRAFAGFYNPHVRRAAERRAFFALLHVTLAVLSAAFRGHHGNRRYFAQRVAGGGWEALEQVVASIGLGASDADAWGNSQLYGKLLSFALDDQRMDELCQWVVEADTDETSFTAEMERRLADIIGPRRELQNAEVMRTVVGFWESIPRPAEDVPDRLSLLVLATVASVAELSLFNLSALHATGILSRFLRLALRVPSPLTSAERARVLPLCRSLMSLGVSELADAQFLLASTDPAASAFCLEMASAYTGPPYVQFDMAHCGHASVALPDLGRSFPPMTGPGYTFSCWLCVDAFEPGCHTTLFGVYDASQTCFLLLYLERDTHCFILQTAISGARPSVRFRAVAFEEHTWYHVALVHRRGKARASLYVNGEFVEQVRAAYPQPPPTVGPGSGSDSFVSVSFGTGTRKPQPVRAFLGTPRDLAESRSRDTVGPRSRWSLASAHLFEDVLSDDYIAVHFRLGPRYQANYQDSLGGFQTYTASARLALRNDFHGKDDNSDILRAIRDKASAILPESKILLSILPRSMFRTDGAFVESLLFRSLSRPAAAALLALTSKSGTAVAVNGALPCIDDALVRPHGAAVLAGDPVLATPFYIDDNLWRLAGFTPLALKLVERATTADELVRATDMVFRCINSSWRNSEAMERDNGYVILGVLLRGKLGCLAVTPTSAWHPVPVAGDATTTLRLLQLVLSFVGYDHAAPIDSFCINPLAYRVLLVDLDLWRRAGADVQRVYYAQFATFAVHSKYHAFNCQRLLRMRIIKRLLDAMKTETLTDETLPHFLQSFESLVRSNYNAEAHRALALFITYALHAPRSTRRPPGSETSSLAETATSAASATSSRLITKRQLGVRILKLYEHLLCEPGTLANIRKFNRTVTNKWLLYLLSAPDADVLASGVKILARLLVSQGAAAVAKFQKVGGFGIMAHRLRAWCTAPTVWVHVLAILFGRDASGVEIQGLALTHDMLTSILGAEPAVVYPDVLVVVCAMLQQGLVDVSDDADVSSDDTLDAVVAYFRALHHASPAFRDFALQSDYLRLLCSALFSSIVHTPALAPDTELASKDAPPRCDSPAVVVRPRAGTSPMVRSASIHSDLDSSTNLAASTDSVRPHRSSSFILLTAQTPPAWHTAKLALHASPRRQLVVPDTRPSRVRDGLVEMVVDVLADQVLARKEFPGFGLGLRTPPAYAEHQAFFESHLLRRTLARLDADLAADMRVVCEPRVLTNLARVAAHLVDGTFDGTLVGTVDAVMDLSGRVLEYLARPDIAALKSVRLCQPAVRSMRMSFLRLVLFRLSDVDAEASSASALPVLERIFYWQSVLVDCLSMDAASDEHNMKLVFYQLYARLLDPGESVESVRLAAASLWRIVLVHKPAASSAVLRQCATPDQAHLARAFRGLTEVDDGAFLAWIDQHRPSLDAFFVGGMARFWDDFVAGENQRAAESCKSRLARRRDRLRQWQAERAERASLLTRHDLANSAWMKSIFNTEHTKLQRQTQDLQDDLAYHAAAFAKMDRDLQRPGAVFAAGAPTKWKLDRTEGRNRMRLRLLPDASDRVRDVMTKQEVQAAAAVSASAPAASASAPVASAPVAPAVSVPPPRLLTSALDAPKEHHSVVDTIASATAAVVASFSPVSAVAGSFDVPAADVPAPAPPPAPTPAPPDDDDFELIDDPNEPDGDDGFEDKNRKVMRRLNHGDVVQTVANVSRIIGLDACEGILIVGRDALYLMDNVFQCRDGEIVNAWQAPDDERDPFSQIIATQARLRERGEQASRNWRWSDVVSVSKRRFLFRDVALELFFRDGRSYLLTTRDGATRDAVHGRLLAKIPAAAPNAPVEDGWRLEALRIADEPPQSLGSKFGSIFNASPWSPSMRRWQRGETSNFYYLMHVNTMAGRTFNDLTQYPVFPWVLADYTSDELDLTNPATFRDLAKPMGAQTPQRQADFAQRYQALLEVGQQPFHYGTHYSSAMVVSSYLIRLPPFVQSFLLLQGGHFDHPDRLFASIEGAWRSASRDNGTDVRELTPEFYCLPEFLSNTNGYDFGRRQDGTRVDHVALPPWAKGDPSIFIAKHREALESPYVSAHLHHWIDLVFGHKQHGDAAVDATNVFHHLSYHGAIDLDNIADPQERAIVTGIIHNFGQTPRQVFSRPHPARDVDAHVPRRLDTAAALLSATPRAILESRARVASLVYVARLDRLLCASPFRLNLPPAYDKYLEWGYADNTVRFFHSDNRKPAGLFENLHIGQVSCVAVADAATLITAGDDCAVSVHAIVTAGAGKPVELLARSALFGHKTPVTTMAVSTAFSTLLTVSTDGVAMLWDLNRLELVRKLPGARAVECARINDVTGDILLCSGPNVVLYSLNGDLLLDQNVCTDPDDFVYACAFYEGAANEWLHNCLIFTGHRRGRVHIWRKTVAPGPRGRWGLELVRRLDHPDADAITCIAPMPTLVYTGDEDGRVVSLPLVSTLSPANPQYEWNLPKDR